MQCVRRTAPTTKPSAGDKRKLRERETELVRDLTTATVSTPMEPSWKAVTSAFPARTISHAVMKVRSPKLISPKLS